MEETKDILGHLFKMKIYKPKSASKHHSWRGLDLGKLSSFPATPAGLQALRAFIVETADKISREAWQGGWLKVTPHFSRDEERKGVRCTVLCDCYRHTQRRGGTITRAEAKKLREGFGVYSPIPVDEQRDSDFWISKSNLHQVGNDYYAPTWMVDNALEEFRAHSKGPWKCLHRFPAVRAVWPPDMKGAWIEAHVGQLPTKEELLQAVRKKEQKQQEWENVLAAEQAAKALERREKEEAASNELARNIKKWEKENRPSQKGVSIELVDIARESLFRRTGQTRMVLEGVDLYYTTARVNIIVDGRWFTLGINNIRVLESDKEVTKTDSPYGLKGDGTPRLQKPGPGRPRKFSEEEVQQRRAECRALWNEVNRDKMREYQRKWREKKKAEK